LARLYFFLVFFFFFSSFGPLPSSPSSPSSSLKGSSAPLGDCGNATWSTVHSSLKAKSFFVSSLLGVSFTMPTMQVAPITNEPRGSS
jgi:hypothetical protein